MKRLKNNLCPAIELPSSPHKIMKSRLQKLLTALSSIVCLRFLRFCQLHQKPVNVYGVYAPLDDAVAELRQGKEREALFGLTHPYVSFCSHPYRPFLLPSYIMKQKTSRMRFKKRFVLRAPMLHP